MKRQISDIMPFALNLFKIRFFVNQENSVNFHLFRKKGKRLMKFQTIFT
jgi:hypothetical protein